ncbi:MAG TPA: hypothetical protein VFW87_02830 [Pirellulales bacterium]|nr:hypothetical protein [Pirellulales bacterium]
MPHSPTASPKAATPCNVTEVPDCPVLIGQAPLELLDFLIDPLGQRLVGNPARGGEQMLELY